MKTPLSGLGEPAGEKAKTTQRRKTTPIARAKRDPSRHARGKIKPQIARASHARTPRTHATHASILKPYPSNPYSLHSILSSLSLWEKREEEYERSRGWKNTKKKPEEEMPQRPLRPCPKVGCSTLIRNGCPPDCNRPTHDPEAERRRLSANKRGYGAMWRKRRASALARQPLCVACKVKGRVTIAVDVDHRIPKAQGGTDAAENLQPLCRECHEEKTARENREKGKR